MINDWEIIIAYWQESTESEALSWQSWFVPYYINSWLVWGRQHSHRKLLYPHWYLIIINNHYHIIINWLFHSYDTCCTERPSSPSDKIWRQWDFKNPNFRFFSELRKIWKSFIGYLKIPIFRLIHELGETLKYTQPKTNISKSKFGKILVTF